MTTSPVYPSFKANDDFKQFAERLQNSFFINKTLPIERAPILLNQIDDATYRTLRGLCDPEPPAKKSFEDLCALLRRQYCPKQSVWKVRKDFFQARQAHNESVNNWYLRLKELTVDCRFDKTLDVAIRCKFVVGLESTVVLNKITEQSSALPMEELLAIAMSMENEPKRKRNPNPHNHQRRGKSIDRTENKNKEVACDINQSRNDYGNQKPLRLCWHCGEAGGHKFSTCVHKTSYCNFCHELGHLEKVCRRMRLEVDKKSTNVVVETKITKQPPPAPIPEELKQCPQCKFFGHILILVPNRPCSQCGFLGHMINACPPKKHEKTVTAARQLPAPLPANIRSAQSPLTSNVRSTQPTPALNVRPPQAAPAPIVRPTQLNPAQNVRPPQAAPAPIVRSVQTPAVALTLKYCVYCEDNTYHSGTTCTKPCRKCLNTGHHSHECDTKIKIESHQNQQQNTKKKEDKCCIC